MLMESENPLIVSAFVLAFLALFAPRATWGFIFLIGQLVLLVAHYVLISNITNAISCAVILLVTFIFFVCGYYFYGSGNSARGRSFPKYFGLALIGAGTMFFLGESIEKNVLLVPLKLVAQEYQGCGEIVDISLCTIFVCICAMMVLGFRGDER